MLIQIRNYRTSEVIFELDKEDNTIKDTIEEAIRRNISLRYADLHDADLHGATLSATVSHSFLCTDLRNANFNGANLSYAYLRYARLRGANLRNANLRKADLYSADLSGADLTDADIRNCMLDIIHNTTLPDFPMACPETGSFIGYKKICLSKEYYDERAFIVKLEIPEDAKRSSATSNKCRCSKAKVLEIKDMKSGETIDEIININITDCTYKVGEYVYPDSFDECRWHECSNGIHFFMTEEEAITF